MNNPLPQFASLKYIQFGCWRSIRTTHKPSIVGFTLIELLVVLVILAMFSSMVVISIGDNFQREMRAEAERLQSLLMATADEAIYTSNEYGFYLSEQGYVIVRFDPIANGWSPLNKKPFLPHELPAGMKMEWSIEGFAMPTDDANQTEIVDFDFNSLNKEQDKGSFFGDETESVFGQENNAQPLNLQPQIFTLSSGEVTVFSIRLLAESLADERGEFLIESDGFSIPYITQVHAQ